MTIWRGCEKEDLRISVTRRSYVAELIHSFASSYFVDPDMIRSALAAESLFNLMHFGTSLKVDLIVRKSNA